MTAFGKDASDFIATAAAKNNQIEIKGDNTIIKGNIIGGGSAVESISGTVAATAESNSITINSGK